MENPKTLKTVVKAWPDTQQPDSARCWFLELECGHVVFKTHYDDPALPPNQLICDECNGVLGLTSETAIERLTELGLECESVPGESLHILGGITRFVDNGIRGYEKRFTIFEEDNGFTAAVSEASPFGDEETKVKTLSEAVDAIIAIYRQRGFII